MKTIRLDEDQYHFYESFFQYGNLRNADYIFMGREEGLNEQGIEENRKNRELWFKEIPNHIQFINTINMDDGYYIDDCKKADWVRTGAKQGGMPFEEYKSNFPNQHSKTALRGHAILMNYIEKGYGLNKKQNDEEIKKYLMNNLHVHNGNTAMIDLYSLPKQGEIKFLSPDGISEKKRFLLVKKLYETYPMTVTIVYFSDKEARKDLPFLDLGFQFNEVNVDTSNVKDEYANLVTPSSKPKNIMIGNRVRKTDRHEQWVIIVPYLRNGAMSNKDLEVLSTWIPRV